MFSKGSKSNGFTLIEMIVIMVVISIVAVSLFGVFMKAVSGSADPMLNMQAIAIAQGYLEEALLQPYSDPNEPETGCEEGALPADRINYDDVQDYDCINDVSGARDQLGNPLVGLGDYNVNVTVTATTLGAGNPAAAQQVDVVVSHDLMPTNVTLTGYRANY